MLSRKVGIELLRFGGLAHAFQRTLDLLKYTRTASGRAALGVVSGIHSSIVENLATLVELKCLRGTRIRL